MKKIALVLVFSLGLVSAVNAESMCDKYKPSYNKIYKFATDITNYVGEYNYDDYDNTNTNKIKHWSNALFKTYTKEFKISDKESLCAYLAIPSSVGFLKTTLTPQELERFERLIAKKGYYKKYENNKDKWLLTLKFLKYYNKLESFSNKLESLVGWKGEYIIDSLNAYIKDFTQYGDLIVRRFVYGNDIGDYYWGYSGLYDDDDFNDFSTQLPKNCEIKANSKEEAQKCKNLKPIVQWTESIIKQSKQKGGQK